MKLLKKNFYLFRYFVLCFRSKNKSFVNYMVVCSMSLGFLSMLEFVFFFIYSIVYTIYYAHVLHVWIRFYKNKNKTLHTTHYTLNLYYDWDYYYSFLSCSYKLRFSHAFISYYYYYYFKIAKCALYFTAIWNITAKFNQNRQSEREKQVYISI